MIRAEAAAPSVPTGGSPSRPSNTWVPHHACPTPMGPPPRAPDAPARQHPRSPPLGAAPCPLHAIASSGRTSLSRSSSEHGAGVAQPADRKLPAGRLFEQARDLAEAGPMGRGLPDLPEPACATTQPRHPAQPRRATSRSDGSPPRGQCSVTRRALAAAPATRPGRAYAVQHAAALQPRAPSLRIMGPASLPAGLTVLLMASASISTARNPSVRGSRSARGDAHRPDSSRSRPQSQWTRKDESVEIRELAPSKHEPPRRTGASGHEAARRSARPWAHATHRARPCGRRRAHRRRGLVFGIRARSTYGDAGRCAAPR